MSRSSRSLEYKTDGQIRSMRKAGLVVAAIHSALREEVRAGVTTRLMDELARGVLEAHGARSNFYGYYGYPAQICVSVNEEIVHGIPGERVLEAGDLVSFDCGAVLDGWHGWCGRFVCRHGPLVDVGCPLGCGRRPCREGLVGGLGLRSLVMRFGGLGIPLTLLVPPRPRPARGTRALLGCLCVTRQHLVQLWSLQEGRVDTALPEDPKLDEIGKLSQELRHIGAVKVLGQYAVSCQDLSEATYELLSPTADFT